MDARKAVDGGHWKGEMNNGLDDFAGGWYVGVAAFAGAMAVWPFQ